VSGLQFFSALGNLVVSLPIRFLSQEKRRHMAKCIWCGVETLLFVLGQPVCVKCDEEQEEERQKQEELQKEKKPEHR
jgi:hypothetical protein